ncbi:MAG: 1-phosphofructokinase [Ruminococcus sp.]|nr:1-phosphofructokinase [Ruminococcus sp.]
MFWTVTFNPAVDYVVRLDRLVTGAVNRCSGEEIFFGGKGINVSCVLAELGVRSVALGFCAGFTGRAIEEGVRAMGVETDLVRLKSGSSRINVKIRGQAETEINGQGPDISEEAIGELLVKLDRIAPGDTLILAGSVPATLPENIYERILAGLSGRRIRFVADASGKQLLSLLRHRPFLVKPNDIELGELFGAVPQTDEEVARLAGRLQEMGAENVLVSMAERGALLLDGQGQIHRCGVCRGELVNSVGAGDSMLAGVLAGLERGGWDYALRLGTACGGATAFSGGLGKRELIDKLMEQLS